MGFKSFAARMAAVATLALGVGFAAAPAQATILVDQASPYGGYSVGGYDWGQFTSALGAQPGGYAIGSVGDAAAVNSASALLIVGRDNNFGVNKSLSTAEMTNITNFLGKGGRVVIIGEGGSWSEWSANLIAFASGGTATMGGDFSGNATPAIANDLTDGITTTLVQGSATVVGGTPLFNQNFATLWGPNLLTVLDLNTFKDFGSPVLRDNVADWLGASAPVPEPATWAMMIAGFGLIGSALRRRSARGLKLA